MSTIPTGSWFLTTVEWGYCSVVEEFCPWPTKINLLLKHYKDSNIGSHGGNVNQIAAAFSRSKQQITSTKVNDPHDQSLICAIKFWEENMVIKNTVSA